MPNRRGREIDVRPFNPQAQPIGALAQVPRSQGDEANSIAAATNRLASVFGNIADEAAQAEGSRAGLVAGNDLSYRPTGDATVRGRAFEASATRTYVHTLQSRLREDVLKVVDDNRDNPAAISVGLSALHQDYKAQHVFPDIAAQFDDIFSRLRLPFDRRALAQIDGRARASEISAGAQSLTSRRRFVIEAAADAGSDDQINNIVGKEIDGLQDELAGAVSRGEIAPVEAKQILADTGRQAVSRAIVGMYERLPNRDARGVFLGRIEEEVSRAGKAFGDLGGEFVVELKDRLFTRLQAEHDAEILAEERAAHEAPQTIEAAALKRFRDGTLEPGWLASVTDYLGNAQRRRLEGMVVPSPDGGADVTQYGELLERAATATPGLIGDAADAFRRGVIDREGFDRIYDTASRFARDVEERPWVIDARSDIVNATKPTPWQTPVHARTQLRALDAFENWLDANPAATRVDIADTADRLIAEFRGRSFRAERAELALPRFAPVSREAVTIESLIAAGQRLRAEHSDGGVSDQELVDQVALMRRWQDVLARQPKRGR